MSSRVENQLFLSTEQEVGLSWLGAYSQPVYSAKRKAKQRDPGSY